MGNLILLLVALLCQISLVGSSTKEEHLSRERPNLEEAIDKDRLPGKNCRRGGYTGSTGNRSELEFMSEEVIKASRLKMFTDRLRKELGLDLNQPARRPSARHMKLHRMPPGLIDDTRENEDLHARERRTIVRGIDMGSNCSSTRFARCYRFQLSGDSEGEMNSAALQFYLTRAVQSSYQQIFRVYEGEGPTRYLIAREITFNKDGWVTVNVTRPVQRWKKEERGSVVLTILCEICEAQNHTTVFGSQLGDGPLLTIKYVVKPTVREKRSEQECNPRERCCRLPLEINFKELGINSIFLPETIDIGYCYGGCEHFDQLVTSNAEHLQNERKIIGDSEWTKYYVKPCCAPTVFKPHSLMYWNGDDVYRNIVVANLAVKSCGCQ